LVVTVIDSREQGTPTPNRKTINVMSDNNTNTIGTFGSTRRVACEPATPEAFSASESSVLDGILSSPDLAGPEPEDPPRPSDQYPCPDVQIPEDWSWDLNKFLVPCQGDPNNRIPLATAVMTARLTNFETMEAETDMQAVKHSGVWIPRSEAVAIPLGETPAMGAPTNDDMPYRRDVEFDGHYIYMTRDSFNWAVENYWGASPKDRRALLDRLGCYYAPEIQLKNSYTNCGFHYVSKLHRLHEQTKAEVTNELLNGEFCFGISPSSLPYSPTPVADLDQELWLSNSEGCYSSYVGFILDSFSTMPGAASISEIRKMLTNVSAGNRPKGSAKYTNLHWGCMVDERYEVKCDNNGNYQFGLTSNRVSMCWVESKKAYVESIATLALIDTEAELVDPKLRKVIVRDDFSADEKSIYAYSDHHGQYVNTVNGEFTEINYAVGPDDFRGVWVVNSQLDTCEYSGELYISGSGYRIRRGGETIQVCPRVYEEVFANDLVLSYHSSSRPELTLFSDLPSGAASEDSLGYTVGFEIEKNEVDGATDAGHYIEPCTLINNWEYDGSCGYDGCVGVEAISNVYDLHSQRDLLEEHIEEAADQLSAPADHYCGGHIHVKGPGLSIDSIRPYAGLLFAIYRHRLNTKYCSGNKRLSSSCSGDNNYPAIRVRGYEHLEFRLVRAVTSGKVLLRRYDLMGLLITAAKKEWTFEGFLRKAYPILKEMYPNNEKRSNIRKLARHFQDFLNDNNVVHSSIQKFVSSDTIYLDDVPNHHDESEIDSI